MAKKFYNIPISDLAEKLQVPAQPLLKELLRRREAGGVLANFTFLDSRPLDLVPADLAAEAAEEFRDAAETVKSSLVNPLDLIS